MIPLIICSESCEVEYLQLSIRIVENLSCDIPGGFSPSLSWETKEEKNRGNFFHKG